VCNPGLFPSAHECSVEEGDEVCVREVADAPLDPHHVVAPHLGGEVLPGDEQVRKRGRQRGVLCLLAQTSIRQRAESKGARGAEKARSQQKWRRTAPFCTLQDTHGRHPFAHSRTPTDGLQGREHLHSNLRAPYLGAGMQ